MMNQDWTTSSYSQAGESNCVEGRTHGGQALVRDSQNRHDGHLAVSVAEWQAFLHAVRIGEM